MSLVITSNEIQGTDTVNSQFQKPYSWTNHLNQNLVLPANSEVAVQSLKVNKDGTITISPYHKFYIYFGVKLSSTTNINDTQSDAHIVDLGITEPTDLTVESLADLLTSALNRGLPTPETFGLAECTVVRNSNGTDFQGFKFKFSSRDNNTGDNYIPTNWINLWADTQIGAGSGLTFNSASNTLTPIPNYQTGRRLQYFNQAMATNTPLSLNGGIYEVDLTNASGTAWGVGLRRCQGSAGQPTPIEYDPSISDLGYSYQYNDFAVYAIQDTILGQNQQFKIRVYCSTYSSDRVLDEDLFLTQKEVNYTTGNGSFTSVYNWSTNASNITKILIGVENENVEVVLASATHQYVLVPKTGNFKKLNASNGLVEPIRFPPIRDTCRVLYPTAMLTQNASNNRSLKIDTWGGRPIPNFTYSNANNDWYAFITQNGLQSQYEYNVETVPRLDTNAGQATITQPIYKGLNASGYFEDYDYVMILKPDNELYKGTELANISKLMGFPNVVVLDNASKSGSNLEISEYTSEVAPTLKSTTSLFVRLNNLPVKSYNAGQSRRSQIIYSAPRFSTGTDQSVGALFFECPEKTYVSLDNPNPINLNTLNIDIVNENETLAEDLLGKTVCTLHFREKKR